MMRLVDDGETASSGFEAPWWCRGPHAQTIFAALCPAGRPAIAWRQECLELPDGDFLDLRWAEPEAEGDAAASAGPEGGLERGGIVLLLHGLEGSYRSSYVGRTVRALTQQGLRAVLVHFRGCGDEVNRLPVAYHSGHTADLEHVLAELRRREPGTPLAAVGFSLGGNVVLKYLAETGDAAALNAAVAVSVPYDLAAAAQRVEQGMSRLYQAHLLRLLRRSVRRRLQQHPDALPLSDATLRRLRNFRAFDGAVTAPLHGFADADDYYTRSSSGPLLGQIAVPTLLIHARDDPFLPASAIPDPARLPHNVQLELSDTGGHVGFVGGPNPLAPTFHLARRIPPFLASRLALTPTPGD